MGGVWTCQQIGFDVRDIQNIYVMMFPFYGERNVDIKSNHDHLLLEAITIDLSLIISGVRMNFVLSPTAVIIMSAA